MNTEHTVGLIVLAGGAGSRMGGVNKALQNLHGAPLIAHVLARLMPHAAATVISANRDLDELARFGCAVVPDLPEYAGAGPLAGMVSAAFRLPESLEYIQVAPCDMPFLHGQMVADLHAALRQSPQYDIAFATVRQTAYPVVCQFRRRHLAHIARTLRATGSHSIRSAILPFAHTAVAFDGQAQAFANCNTAADLAQLAANSHKHKGKTS